MRFHLSVDDVFGALLQMSDWDLGIEDQPMLDFLHRLHEDHGVVTDLYLFGQVTAPSGTVRSLGEITESAAARLAAWPAVRFGPHALDYPTPPHAQPLPELLDTMNRLSTDIARFSTPEQRARWLRLHFFSECYEAAAFWAGIGVEALMTTDKPAIAYRLEPPLREELARTGRTKRDGLGFIRSHLRLEFFKADAADPARFCARVDEVLDRHGFVTLFTHEIELNDPRVRRLAGASLAHLARRGVASV